MNYIFKEKKKETLSETESNDSITASSLDIGTIALQSSGDIHTDGSSIAHTESNEEGYASRSGESSKSEAS